MPIESLSLLNFSASSIFAGLIFSTIGLWMWKQAKDKESLELRLIAVALMIYTYFTKGPIADWGIGIALCGWARYKWWG